MVLLAMTLVQLVLLAGAAGATAVGKKCSADRKVKVKEKSIYRATALSSAGAVLASSPAVTIKLK